MLSQCVF